MGKNIITNAYNNEIYAKTKATNSAKSAGKWVTINGRHVLLD